ncbi:phrB [Symbiodinium necroappetens]|uniref:PhrB protein n=1 Tax=Symbiodinium necroappetens TaxID=1628268 RepID=A0A812JMS5_9DINO|nr:phrB [Symbiodinium necroappetens]
MPKSSHTRALVWFRSDLRIDDNPALSRACEACDEVVAVFLVAGKQWREHDMSDVRLHFMLGALRELKEHLETRNIPLLVREAPRFKDAPDAIAEVAGEVGATLVTFNREHELNEIRRDEAVRERLEDDGVEVRSFLDQCLVDPDSVRTGEGKPYSVFTPFRKSWLEELGGEAPEPLGKPRAREAIDVAGEDVPDSVKGFGGAPEHLELWPMGESNARRRLTDFLKKGASDYKKERDRVDLDSTSRMSAYLAVGAISARRCVWETDKAGHSLGDWKTGEGTWVSEIVWREFYRHVMENNPRVCMHKAFRPETEKIPWNEPGDHFEAWKEGRTGVPIVDAGMRQLVRTGWMHNRLRMIVAMFLTKNLLVDWREGERFFMQHLVDGDLGSNNGGWQWSASTGTDAAPYFRIFNPYSQSEKTDPDGEFIREHVEELAGVEGDDIHEPSEENRGEYPEPIVDVKQSRKDAIETFKGVLKGPVILCPLRYEAGFARRLLSDVADVVCFGPYTGGMERAFESGELDDRPLVLVVGVGGGLTETGVCPVVERVVDLEGNAWVPSVVDSGDERVTVVGVDVIVPDEASKRAMARETGASVVDMESHVVARRATERGMRWCVVRGVSDGPEQEFPAWIAADRDEPVFDRDLAQARGEREDGDARGVRAGAGDDRGGDVTDRAMDELAARLNGDGAVLLFGGTFDPPHRAHVELPMRARAAYGAAWLVYVPAAQSPHKADAPGASGEERVAMLEAAVGDAEGVVVSRIEIDAPEGPSYTVRTLERVRAALGASREVRLLIGADQAVSFHRWREYERVMELAEPLVMLRSPDETRDSLLASMRPHWDEAALEAWGARVVDVPVMDVSATRVRELLERGAIDSEELRGLLPEGVIGVIRARALVPKHIAAPASDIVSGVVRLPDPEFTGVVSEYARFDVGGAVWVREVAAPEGADLDIAVVGAAVLEGATPERSDGRAKLYGKDGVGEGAVRLAGRGEGVVLVRDGAEKGLYANVTSHGFVKDRAVGICARVLDLRLEDGLRVPDTGSSVSSAVLRVVGEGEEREYVMRDDGVGLDARAGDGVFTATVPLPGAGAYDARVHVKATADGIGAFERSASLMLPVVEALARVDGEMAVIEDAGADVLVRVPVVGEADRVKVGAEVWARLAGDEMVPVCWVGGIVEPAGGFVSLLLDPRWAGMVDGEIVGLELWNVRLQDVDTGVPMDRVDVMAVEGAGVMLGKARGVAGGGITKGMLAKHPGMGEAVEVELSGVERVAGGHNLMLVHGYCTGGNPFPVSHFSGFLEVFGDPNATRSHDAFAQLVGALGGASKSFGIVGHSQGGCAALHLYTYYWSGLDWAEGGRLIQSVGTPYQGTPLAGDLAGIGEVFGQGCGTNFDLSPDGSAIWLAGIPTASRQKVHYYTTSFEDEPFQFDFCNFFTDLVLSDPDDGVIERARGQLPGANNRGHVEGWCHTTGMSDPPQTQDLSRNTEMNANAGSTVTGVTVSVRVAHEWIGDVVVFMEHGGILLRLVDRPGVGSFTFGCGGEELDVLVTDSPGGGAAPCTPENPRFVGEVAPLDALSFYNGVEVDGVWRVTFRDVHQFDSGTVEEVCVNVTYEAPAVCVGDCDGSGEVDFNDLVAMLFEFGSEPVVPACDADGSGGVDFNDLVSALFVFGGCAG